MRILSLLETTVPLTTRVKNAVIDFSRMTVSAVAVITDAVQDGQPVIGYGFGSCGRYAQGGILRERLFPRLLQADPSMLLTEDGSNLDPFRAWNIMTANEKPGGHGDRSSAIGAVDMAVWDVVAKIEQRPLYRVLSERYNQGRCNPCVPVYAAGGYYQPGSGHAALKDELTSYLDRGYETVKIKVGGAPLDEDLGRIDAALDVVGQGHRLAVDANARFNLENALRFSKAVAPYGLKWYEEPCDPLDYEALATVAGMSSTPIATGENLFSLADSLNLIRYGGLCRNRDVLQMDPALSYGLVEYLRILQMLDRHGWSRQHCIPHGGHQFGLHIAAGLGLGGNESYPGMFFPFGGFGDDMVVNEGLVRVPDAPGIGLELKRDLMSIFDSLVKRQA